jgi:hypothetical protein
VTSGTFQVKPWSSPGPCSRRSTASSKRDGSSAPGASRSIDGGRNTTS